MFWASCDPDYATSPANTQGETPCRSTTPNRLWNANRAQRSGIDDCLRQQINHAAGAYVIDWWGSFDELAQGETEFAQGIVEHFLDEEVPRSLRAEELDDFVEHLAQSAW